MTTKKIGIIGKGNVGGALARGLSAAGYEVRAVGRGQARDVARWADVAILAVPFAAVDAVAAEAGGALAGKTVIDATNPLGAEMNLALGYTTSAGEEVQKKLPGARVAKAFNTIFAQHLDSGRVDGKTLTSLVAADSADAKATALELSRRLGFDAVDAGPLTNARLLEPMAYLNIQLGYVLQMGPQIGFCLAHR
jgi:predicted dinucleotide-binding enzyme